MTTSAYIARTLIRERLKGFERFGLVVSATTYSNLAKCRSVKSVRQIEAQETKRFWSLYFDSLNVEISRRENHPVTAALDAVSFFMHGICLRWILAHRFSPAHGYLHEPTRYTALVYDVIEPYRYIIETAVKNTWLDSGETKLVEKSINNAKELLEGLVYCHETRQEVKRKSLLHGVVLALRSYLLNETTRFVIPTEGKRIGGRPLKLAFRMPGPK
jgi:CRISPR/Cas system-associated endonuclease Cas1